LDDNGGLFLWAIILSCWTVSMGSVQCLCFRSYA
jgi:hypothetical protein